MLFVWLSELSERSGVPIPTIKYYRREGLLPAGEQTDAAARSRYDDGHLERLRLIRALVGVAGMPIVRVRDVLAAVDDPALPVAAAMGSAHLQLSPDDAEPSAGSRARVATLVQHREWPLDPDDRHGRAVAVALDAMDGAGLPMADGTLAAYADAADAVGRVDLDGMADLSRTRAVERAVTGTVLGEPVLLGLRRMAHEALARRRGPR